MKIGFADAVRDRGDRWLYAIETKGLTGERGKMSAATWCAMRSRTDSEARSALTMELCGKYGRTFQVEQPVYRCGCNGLCPKHPDCPGVVYTPGFPYGAGTSKDEPRCDKCGAEITTGLMAVFCPKGKECEFWVPEVEEFKEELNDA